MLRPIAFCIALTLYSFSAETQFTGNLELKPAGCEAAGSCKLTYDLLFKDSQGLEWQADAQNTTDGASIPAWAQRLVGQPFDPSFIKAAVIHDHYCDRHVRSWRTTHRVFFDALIDQGMTPAKAKLMYYAVYLAGPKWIKLIPGKPCGTGLSCTNLQVDGDVNAFTTGEEIYITRTAQYDVPGFEEELQTVEKLLNADSEIGLETLESRAKTIRPNDFYYENEGELKLDGALQFQ